MVTLPECLQGRTGILVVSMVSHLNAAYYNEHILIFKDKIFTIAENLCYMYMCRLIVH